MYLVVGLGNPGIEYEKTRHNMGFQTIDKLANHYEIAITRRKFEGLYGDGRIKGEKVILLKPQTFMNLSGKCIAPFMEYYKLELENIMIVYDDMEIEPGFIKIRKKGGAGSHNGMKSIIQELQTQEFARVRVGIGEPQNKQESIAHVIGAVEKEEWEILEQGTDLAVKAVESIIEEGIDIAMNQFNKKG